MSVPRKRKAAAVGAADGNEEQASATSVATVNAIAADFLAITELDELDLQKSPSPAAGRARSSESTSEDAEVMRRR